MTSPAEYVAAMADRFRSLEPALLDLQHQAAEQAARYGAEGREVLHSLARASVERTGELRTIYGKALDTLDELAAVVPGLGAVVVPAAYAAAVAALALSMAYIFRRMTAEERILAELEAGRLTADQAEALLAQAEGGAPSPLGELALLAAIAFGAWLFVTRPAQGARF